MKKWLLLLLSVPAFGQGVRYDSHVWSAATNVPAGASAPLYSRPNTQISVCADPADASPCTNLVSIYSDAALTAPLPNPITTDVLGRFGFYLAPGDYVYSILDGNGGSLGDIPITVSSGLEAENRSGADIGAKINAAFAANQGKVTLLPGHKYDFSTTITFPLGTEDQYPILDCQGSTLNYTGSSDAILVSPGIVGPYKSGLMKDCVLTGTSAAANAIHQKSRVGMTYQQVSVSGFTGAGSAALLLDNTRFDGTTTSGGSGWNERLEAEITSFLNTFGIRTKSLNGGTNSYAYAHIDLRCQFADGQVCMSIEGTGAFRTADMYGSVIWIKANGEVTSVIGGVLQALSGATVRQSQLLVSAESGGTAFGAKVDASSSIAGCGFYSAPAMQVINPGGSDQISIAPNGSGCESLGPTYQPGYFQNPTAQSTNSKWNISPAGIDYYGASYGGFPYGHFAVWARVNTDVSPESDGAGKQTLAFFDPAHLKACFGPMCDTDDGYAANVEVKGSFAVHRSVGLDTTAITRLVDSDGTVADDFHSITLGGQPSQNYVLRGYDAINFAETNAYSCNVGNGIGNCTVNGDLSIGPQPTLPCTGVHKTATSAGGGEFNYAAGATGVKDILQVCAKDITNAWAWRTLY